MNSFANFLQDMGPKPGPGYSLGRIDHDLDYEPSNCRWMTLLEQSRTRSNSKLSWEGVQRMRKMHRDGVKIAVIAREMGIAWGLASQVIKKKIWKKPHLSLK
jgi:hypothetical protein